MKTKLVLEYDFNDIDAQLIVERMKESPLLYAAVKEFDDEIRQIVKYGDESKDPQYFEGLRKAREILWEHINDNKIRCFDD